MAASCRSAACCCALPCCARDVHVLLLPLLLLSGLCRASGRASDHHNSELQPGSARGSCSSRCMRPATLRGHDWHSMQQRCAVSRETCSTCLGAVGKPCMVQQSSCWLLGCSRSRWVVKKLPILAYWPDLRCEVL